MSLIIGLPVLFEPKARNMYNSGTKSCIVTGGNITDTVCRE